MVSDFGYEINEWNDFLSQIKYKDIDEWSKLALATRYPVRDGYSNPLHLESVFVFGLFLELIPRTPENMCYIIDELPPYILTNP